VSVKCRIGLGEKQNYLFLKKFISYVSKDGCNKFFIHARNAILSKFNPKKNRTIPSLNYKFVYKIKKDFPHFRRRENPGDAIRYFPEEAIEYIPDKYGSHVFPFALKNIKQMFTFDTSTGLVKQFYGSNLVYLTLSHDGDLEIKFDGQISNIVQNNPIFENIDSVSFVRDQIFLNGENNKLTFHSWKQLLKKFSLKATPIYFHLIRFKLTYKSSPLVTDIYLITNYIQIKKSKKGSSV
jgi:hypothetical protein